MRLSWLDPRTVEAARHALGDSDPPSGVTPAQWPAIQNLIGRAEAVSSVVRTEGVDAALERYADSAHAVEVAVLIMAASSIDRADIQQIRSLLECDIDEELLYGTFLRLLVEVERSRIETLAIYVDFLDKISSHASSHPQWQERVAFVREGLAELYIVSGRYDAGHELFCERHQQDAGDLTVALAASRAFLAAAQPARAAEWLGRAAQRAKSHGRTKIERTLREKQRALEQREEQ